MSGLTHDVAVQLDRAYRTMAREARYRPAAPSDGLGSITVPLADLDLDAECRDYARAWWRDEDNGRFHIGCPCFETRPAMVYAVEAARALCGVDNDLARRLLQLAIDDLDGQEAVPSP
jgi:hypothetical protein